MREGEGPRFTRERKGRISTRSWVLGRVVDGVDGACDGTVSQLGVTMARTRNAVKRQKVATVESALFNPAGRPARRARSSSGVADVQGAWGQGDGSLRRPVIGRGGGEAAV